MKKIILIGDIILDINHHCITNRFAPENNNIPIYNIINTEYILGGVANNANNLNNLHNCEIELLSVIGNDFYSTKIIELLNNNNIKYKFFLENNRITTQKYRLFSNNNMFSRHDIETTEEINEENQNNIFNYIKSIKNIDAIIISDYNKGTITYDLCQKIINYSNNNNILTFIDPKINNIFKYKNSFLIKPNLYEAKEMTNKIEINDIIDKIYSDLNINNIIITADKDGCYVYNNSKLTHINKKYNFKLLDVTGAGDIFLSIFVYSYLMNNDMILSAKIANYIANKSITCIGNYLTSDDDLLLYNDIIYDYEIDKIKLIKKNYNNICFTNGCFDVIHAGHIKLLQFAKTKGDILIVAINSDESIKIIKGKKRPINNINLRIELLKSLNIIDYIIIFNTSDPLNIIKILNPLYLIKGPDYNNTNVIGSEYANNTIIYNSDIDISSSKIINKINHLS